MKKSSLPWDLDIDIQLADTLASLAGTRYFDTMQHKQKKISQIEQMKLELIERKLTNKANPSIFEVLI